MKKNFKIEISSNPATGYVFVSAITGDHSKVTAKDIEKAKADYYAEAKKLAAARRAARSVQRRIPWRKQMSPKCPQCGFKPTKGRPKKLNDKKIKN